VAHKNDYSVIVFFPDRITKKWTYVHTIKSFAAFLNSKHPGWEYFNVYDRRSGGYLRRFYPGDLFPYFL